VSGEPGIGKTRLVEELDRRLSERDVATAWARMYAVEGGLAYAPVVDWLRSKALRRSVRALDQVWLAEVARLLPELLVETPGLRRPERLSGPQLRQRLFEALERAMVACEGPLLFVLDDLQWCDQDSLEFLHHLLLARADARLLVVATLRSEEVRPAHPVSTLLTHLRRADRLTEVRLGPLDRADVAGLASQLLASRVGDDLGERLWRDTEGNPLFLVETVRAGLGERDVLPAKVQAVIEARLAQLSSGASGLVACAATIGREFSVEVLSEAAGYDDLTLADGLDELWSRQIIRQQGSSDYDFTHDKIREVAYAGIGPARRRQLHLAVARVLEAPDPAAGPGSVSGQIAAHYEAAGQAAKAVPFYRQAAEQAQHVFATDEALSLLDRALALLEHVPDGSLRDEQELAVRVALGVSLVARKGYAAPATRENYDLAYRLCERLGRAATPPVLRGLALASIITCDVDRPLALAGQILKLADEDPILLTEGEYLLGVTRFWRGELSASQVHLDRAISAYQPEHQRKHLQLFAQDPKVICLARLGQTLWYLGLPDQAERACDEAVRLAEKLGHPFTLAYALVFRVWQYCDRGQHDRMAELAGVTAQLTDQRGLEWQRGWAHMWLGWAQAVNGEPRPGARRIGEVLDNWAATGENLARTYGLSLRAQAHALAGDPRAALDDIDAAFEFTERTGQRYLESELHRIRGEFLHALGQAADAERCLRRSLAVARRQGARILELRAAVSLARLCTVTEPLTTATHAFDGDVDLTELAEGRTLLERLRPHSAH
jgi:predicted ATPase